MVQSGHIPEIGTKGHHVIEKSSRRRLDATLPNLLKHDGPAGMVVFLVALPLCLGIALASGAPLFSGIIAGVVGGIVVSVFSGSNVSVSGPAAGLAAIVAIAIQDIGYQSFLLACLDWPA